MNIAIDNFVSHLVVHEIIPAGRFSPRLTTGIQLALLTALSGVIIDTSAKEIKKRFKQKSSKSNLDEIFVIFSDIAAALLISVILLGLYLIVLNNAFGLIQYSLRPELVEPLSEWNSWVPNETQVINILGGLFGSALAIIYVRTYVNIASVLE